MTAAASPKKSSSVDVALANRALHALLKHHQADSEEHKSLLGDDKSIQVQFTLEKVPENPSSKPIRISIPHSLHKVGQDEDEGVEEPSVCLIVKEESKKWVQEMIANFPKEMGFVKKVLGLQSLRKKHARFEQRRQLLARFDVFMADDRILPMLAKSLGKDFFRAKKQPIPIAITRKQALPFTIMQSLQATFLFISAGTTLTVRAGTTGMPPKHVLENIQAVVENAVPKIPRKWSNIRSISIKTPNSMSLPFYNRTPDELAQISKMAGLEEEQAQEQEDVKAQKETKRKLAAKSPLVQALKKMEKDEPNDPKLSKKETKKSIEKKMENDVPAESKETKRKVDKKVKLESGKSKEVTTESAEKKRRTMSAGVDVSKHVEPKVREKETKKSSETVGKKVQDDFIASKKYKGSKEGYVFRNGKQGVGYYVDVKPVVDRMAMEAFKRLGASQSRRRGQKSPKSKGGRGRR